MSTAPAPRPADNNKACRVRAAARDGVVAVVLAGALVAALEALQLVWPEVREVVPTWLYVAVSALVPAALVALRAWQAVRGAMVLAGQDEGSPSLGCADEVGPSASRTHAGAATRSRRKRQAERNA